MSAKCHKRKSNAPAPSPREEICERQEVAKPTSSRYKEGRPSWAKTNILDKAMGLFLPFERRGEPLAPRWLFARRLVINIGLAVALILVSLVGGMAGYHYIEGSGWLDAFDQTAMILGGMGPYSEPKTDGGKLFAGLYALYSGLLLIGVTGLILAPLFHRMMHYFHLPDDEDTTGGASKRVKTPARPKA